MEPFSLPYFREAILEILLLAIPCGLIGTWVILRGLAFHSHAVGTATFPGLVLAEGLGFAAFLGAAGAALAFTLLSVAIGRSRRTESDAVTALALAACLAAGVILASDVFDSGAGVDTLLFGSLLAIGPTDLWLALAAAGLALLAAAGLGHHWLARGFDRDAARSLRSDSAGFDAALLAVIGLTVIASLGAVGALLVSTLIVVPAATARLLTRRLAPMQALAVILVATEGLLGLWLSALTDAPPGATVAVTSGAVFLLVMVGRGLIRNRPPAPAATLAAIALVATLGVGCGTRSSGGDGPRVVATTTQTGDLVREVGGAKVNLTTLLKPNTDPHEYEPRPSDVQAVADAELIFRSGGDLDGWTRELIADSGSKARVIELSDDLPERIVGPAGQVDPHWWHDPVNVRSATGRIAAALSGSSPREAGYFRRRARRFDHRIRNLTSRIRICLRHIPEADRKIATDHDSFDYFTRRFGIRTVGSIMPALNAAAQPSAGDLAELARVIRREGVKAILPEESLSPALTAALARDAGVTVGRALYGDTLGPEGSPGATWLGAMKANADSVMLGMSGGRMNCFGAGDE